MASITHRGPYQYQAVIRRRGFATQTKTFETEKEAREWAQKVEAKMRLNEFDDNRKYVGLTLGQLLDWYGEFVEGRNLGAAQELKRIAQIKKRPVAERYVLTLTPSDFVEYEKARKKEGVGPNTIRLELSVMRAAFKRKIAKGGLKMENPVGQMETPVPSGRERRLVGDEEARLLAAAREDGRFSQELEAAILLAIETGLRESRLAALLWSDIDLKEEVVKVLTKKPKRGEMKVVDVPLSEFAVHLPIRLELLPGCQHPRPYRS